MYHLLKNVDENWRKLLISIFENDLILKNFLQKYSDGDIQENVYPDKRYILKPFEEKILNHNLVVISERKYPLFYPQQLKKKRILNLYFHFTYTMSTEDDKYHNIIWEYFLFRVIKYLEKEYSPIFLVLGKKILKPFYTFPKENIFFDEGKIPNIDFDIQYKPVVIYTDKFTESTKILINHLLKLKKQPLINFKPNGIY